MKERVTYIQRDKNALLKPDDLEVKNASLAVPGILAVKEHTITVSYKEIPSVLWRFLRNAHEFHLRWQGHRPFVELPPYNSRISPGLHVSFTPLQGRTGKRLCSLMKESFGKNVQCESLDETFTTTPILSERFSASASKQFYNFVPSILELSIWVQKEICGDEQFACRLRGHDLKDADSVDVDYDAISQTMKVKAIWTRSNSNDMKWYETHHKGSQPEDTLEVGVLLNETPEESEELRYSGFLTQVGKDTKPDTTLFSFPARYHPLPEEHHMQFLARLQEPTGLHPILALEFPSTPTPPNPSCKLHAYLVLPSSTFLDKYSFSDPLFLSTHNLKELHSISGATDLEAPAWTVKEWGSASLFELAPPSTKPNDNSNFTVTVPLHARYQPPSNLSHVLVPVPWPAVFWSCPAEKGSRFAATPFDRTNLGYDGLFGTNTLFYPIQPKKDIRQVATLQVPVLDLEKASPVEWGTIAAVLFGSIFVLMILVQGLRTRGYSGPKKTAKKD